jgi:phosphatidate phosphatase APP1
MDGNMGGPATLDRSRRLPMTARSLCVVLALTSTYASAADPAIILYPQLGRPDHVTVAGRVLQSKPSKGSSTLSRNLRRLMAPNWSGAPVEAAFFEVKGKATSGHDGSFELRLDAPPKKPFALGLATVDAQVPGASERSAIRVVGDDAPFVVVSDFDDTVAVTNVLHKDKLLAAALLKDADTTPPVEGMSAWYRCLQGAGEKKVEPAFALVSGSPVQFTSRITAFLSAQGFPFMGLYLRDLGPDTLKGYKQPIIRKLAAELPNPLVLIGDSGEHDPEVYAEMVGELKGRVLRVYIHDVGRSEDPKRFEGMFLFKDARAAAKDAVDRGLMSKACLEKAFATADGGG